MVGTMPWREKRSDKRYFVVATSQKRRGFGCDQVIFNSRDEAGHFRRQLMLELCSRPPLVVHDFDDELEMVQWCNATWPCEKTASILRDTERERQEMTNVH
jgi:hypothetical protein